MTEDEAVALIVFAKARLDEEEAAAQAATPGPWEPDGPFGADVVTSALLWNTPDVLGGEDLLDIIVHLIYAETKDHGLVRLLAVAAAEGYRTLPRGGELERLGTKIQMGRSQVFELRARAQHADMAELAAGEDRTTALYRWFDEADLPLYIGISGNLGSRTRGHVRGSSWMEFVARSTVERYPNRRAALDAEEAAVKAERPLFNYQHNGAAENRERVTSYLTAHGRLDLLVPASPRSGNPDSRKRPPAA